MGLSFKDALGEPELLPLYTDVLEDNSFQICVCFSLRSAIRSLT